MIDIKQTHAFIMRPLQKEMFAHYDIALVRGEFTEVCISFVCHILCSLFYWRMYADSFSS
jgi:hypothetical protein